MVSVILRKPKSHWISDKMCKKLKKFSMKRYLLVVLSIALLSCSQDDQPVSSLEPIEGVFLRMENDYVLAKEFARSRDFSRILC